VRSQPPSDRSEYISQADHYGWLGEAYRAGASSRTTRATYPELELGTWRIDDHEGLDGHDIWELVEFSPRELAPGEFSWDDPREELRYGGKWRDVERYADWLRAGGRPPPISALETVGGDLRVIDGHRRLAAADLAGKPVRAWVSWTAPHPEGLLVAGTSRPIRVGLTHEIARTETGGALKRKLMR
jgi:hypothetical protein